ncbi:transcriptional regulator [Paenibacillus sp. MY03]|uniref:AlbA family DNA-binding domain-containing protein n=1 Tax=Paenibacillus sp. MY03 TaxID=302980 RepID=UPI000B3D0EA5|nr:ATP-binding protein [Paenibacillus sp. MY03]OUS68712.1 transcriptional regulator [Paenibacillus sp. MY03]
MNISDEVTHLIGSLESEKLEYKAVLPPSRSIAQLISGFANTNGGFIILGVAENRPGDIEIVGLSEDFHVNSIVHKAIDLLSPSPQVHYQYVIYRGKTIYAIKIEHSTVPISIENKIYIRNSDGFNIISNQVEVQFKANGYMRIKEIAAQLESYNERATNAKSRYIEHYQSLLKLFDDLSETLYPHGAENSTDKREGKVLLRILFSSFVDNFEVYLSDLLYEIFLAKPDVLKSKEQVTVEEVLKCSDIQEFVEYLAKKKIGKLQKGSVKGFIADNKQISQLNVIDKESQEEIEKVLQIRHLYSHRNGIVDEKFLQYFVGQFILNEEHSMSASEICDILCYLAAIVEKIDLAAMERYRLA